MKTHQKPKLAGIALLAVGLVGTPVLAQTATGSTSRPASSDPQMTPSPQGPGSTVGQSSPASPTDPTGRPIDRGSGNNPNRINSSVAQPGVDSSRPATDAFGGAAVGYSQQKKAGDVIGKAVRGSDKDELGQIRDLVIDAQTGQITFAIVNSGGVLGIGGTRRAVPFSALSPTGDDGDLTINLDRARWDSAPQFREDELATLTRQNRGEEIYRHYGATFDGSPSGTVAAPATGERSIGTLVLASHLKDKDIRGGDKEVGEVEDVLVDIQSGRAALLVELEDDFVDTDETYVISFNQLNISGSGRDATLSTQLTPAEFQSTSDTAGFRIGSDRPYAWREGAEGETTRTTQPTVAAQRHPNSGLQSTREGANYASAEATPSPAQTSRSSTAPTSRDRSTTSTTPSTTAPATGLADEPVQFSQAAANPQNRPAVSARDQQKSGSTVAQDDRSLDRRADAVREALRDDSRLRTAAQNVDVTVRGDSLVLTGTVASAEEREDVLEAARRVAVGQRIDDQLRVRGAAE